MNLQATHVNDCMSQARCDGMARHLTDQADLNAPMNGMVRTGQELPAFRGWHIMLNAPPHWCAGTLTALIQPVKQETIDLTGFDSGSDMRISMRATFIRQDLDLNDLPLWQRRSGASSLRTSLKTCRLLGASQHSMQALQPAATWSCYSRAAHFKAGSIFMSAAVRTLQPARYRPSSSSFPSSVACRRHSAMACSAATNRLAAA